MNKDRSALKLTAVDLTDDSHRLDRTIKSIFLRAFSREGFELAILNVIELVRESRTRPIEASIGTVLFLGGLVYAMPYNLFNKSDIYRVMVTHTPQWICATYCLSCGSILLFSLLQQSVNTNKKIAPKADLPHVLLYKVDSYYAENRVFLAARRTCLISAAGWFFYALLALVAATPYGASWIPPFVFLGQSVWVVIKLRVDESDAKIKILSYRQNQSRLAQQDQIRSIFNEMIWRIAEERESADALGADRKDSAVRGARAHSSA